MGAAELAAIQDLDTRLVDLNRQVAAVEARLRDFAELMAARHTAGEREAELRAGQAAVDEAERSAAGLRLRATTVDRQLYGGSVRNPADLLTLDRELNDLRARLASVEEEELRLMEALDMTRAAVGAAWTTVEEIEERHAAAAGPDTEHLRGLLGRVADSVAERDLLRSRRSAAELALYDGLAARMHPAVARLGPGDVCSGCRIAVSPREARAVRVGDGMPQCPNCDRVLAR